MALFKTDKQESFALHPHTPYLFLAMQVLVTDLSPNLGGSGFSGKAQEMSIQSVRNRAIMDTVAAYDALAPYYKNISASRSRYLHAVEQIIATYGHGASSLLDIGAGDAVRTLRIAAAANIPKVVGLEPSARMRARIPAGVDVWECMASEIPESAGAFDLITCLWNVLGSMATSKERISALARARRLLTPRGTIFLDVNHRYNASAYGWNATLWRIVRDRVSWSERSGDVIAAWDLDGHRIQARGHVFIQRELEHIFQQTGLVIRKRWALDYESGALCRSSFQGNLLYCLAAGDSPWHGTLDRDKPQA